MPWPTKIQLHDSQYSHSYDGSEVIETWYVEPMNALTAFVASCLGRVDKNGDNPIPVRTLPAQHFLYPYCFAVDCNVVPYDPRSFSYMGTTALEKAIPQFRAANVDRIQTALFQKTLTNLNPTESIHYEAMPDRSADYSAGVFVTVSYRPVYTVPGGYTKLINGQFQPDFDLLNFTMTPRIRTNTINAGLKLYCPAGQWVDPAAGIAGALGGVFGPWVRDAVKWVGSLLPDAGIAPVFKEEYQEITLERRMCLPDFKLSQLNKYIGHTNFKTQWVHDVGEKGFRFYKGTLLFTSFDTNWVRVPAVDDAGNPDGYNEWLDLKLHIDWRTIWSNAGSIDHDVVVDDDDQPVEGLPVYDGWGEDATGKIPPERIGWNHVLAYPGAMRSPLGLAWYRAKFSKNLLPALPQAGRILPRNDCDPYPMARNFSNIWKTHW